MLPAENLNRYLKALYPLALLLTLVPLIDWTAKVYPFFPGLVQWRFGAEVSLVATLGIVLTGFGLMGAIAAFCGHRTVLRVLSAIAAVGTALAFTLLVFFLLDAAQMRGGVSDENVRAGLTKALISGSTTALMSTVVLASMALGMWRASAGESPARRSAERKIIRGHASRTQPGVTSPSSPTT